MRAGLVALANIIGGFLLCMAVEGFSLGYMFAFSLFLVTALSCITIGATAFGRGCDC